MSTHALTAGSAGFAPRSTVHNGQPGSLMQRVQAWWQVRQTVRELSRLNDRELADIGLVRADIRRVATGEHR